MLTRVAVAVAVLGLLVPAASLAQGFNQGDKEILLNGAGVSDRDFDSTLFSIEGSFGYFLTKNIEASIRQDLSFSTVEHTGSSWMGTTRGALDYNFDLGRFWPFVGGSIGYIYGDDVTNTWEAGLEGGLKFFVNNTTFVLGMVEYQWFLHSSDTGSEFDDGQFVYVIGIGFRW